MLPLAPIVGVDVVHLGLLDTRLGFALLRRDYRVDRAPSAALPAAFIRLLYQTEPPPVSYHGVPVCDVLFFF